MRTAYCYVMKTNESEFDAEVVTGLYTWRSSVLLSYQNDSRCPENCILVADAFQIADYNEEHPNAPLGILNQRIKGFYEPVFRDVPFLSSILEKAVPFFTESGVLNHIMSNYNDKRMLRPPPAAKKPQVMTMNHLGISFKVYLIFIAVSFLSFAIEVCVHFIDRLKRN